MANATKLMKQKKDRITAAKRKAKGLDVEVVDVDSGTVTDINVVDVTEYTEEELSGKLKSELITIAEELDLDTDGTKSELIDRILNAREDDLEGIIRELEAE